MMTADEILKALEESEGFYLEVGDWVVAKEGIDSDHWGMWAAKKYTNNVRVRTHYSSDFSDALKQALQP